MCKTIELDTKDLETVQILSYTLFKKMQDIWELIPIYMLPWVDEVSWVDSEWTGV